MPCTFRDVRSFISFHISTHRRLQGRPKGVTPKYSLKPLVARLSELLGVNVCHVLPSNSLIFYVLIILSLEFCYLVSSCIQLNRWRWLMTVLVKRSRRWWLHCKMEVFCCLKMFDFTGRREEWSRVRKEASISCRPLCEWCLQHCT